MARITSVARGATGSRARSINSMVTDYKAFVGVVNKEARSIMLGAAKIGLKYVLPKVPVQYGGLYESGSARVVKTEKGYAGIISFGGPENPVRPTPNAPAGIVDYAPMVNYNMEREYSNGQAYFLEDGTSEAKAEMESYIMTRLKRINP